MKSDRFERLQGLIAEAQSKGGLLDGLATRMSGKRDEYVAQWKKLQPLAGPSADITKLTPADWNGLPASTQDEILAVLGALIATLDDVNEDEGSGWLMSRRLVSTFGILLLALYSFAITGSVLWVIATNWKQAVPQPQAEAVAPDEALALRMVVYMGMLGGCLHLLSSFVRYVGDRKLARSWLLYYMAVPVQGGGLALLIYLLLRVGVLAPAENGSGGIAQANLIGIYAFAGLTGMFARSATEKLGEVFLTIFRTSKPAGDSVKERP
jgi:hypothetical protein